MIIEELMPNTAEDFEPIVLGIECESIEDFANLFGRFYPDDWRVAEIVGENTKMPFQHASAVIGGYFALCSIGGKHFYWGE